MKVLLDTSTLIAAVKGRLPVVLRLQKLPPAEVAVSRISCMEAEMTLRRAPQVDQRLARLLRELIGAVRVLDFAEEEARQAASLAPYLDGTATSALDLQVAATALAHGLTLITESPQRFAFIPGLDAERWS